MKLLSLCRSQAIDLSRRTVFRWTDTLNVNLIGVVRNTIHDGIVKSALPTADLLVPLIFPELGAEDGRLFFSAFVNQLEKISGFWFCQFEQKPFINDQQDWLAIVPQYTGVGSRIPGRLQIQQQICKPDILHGIIVFACLHHEGTCHICFTAPCSATNKDVAVFYDVFASHQTVNQSFV